MSFKTTRAKLSSNPIIRIFASLQLTTVCLFLLGVLTLWGTIDQVNNGLYLAQQKFFNSFFIPVGPVFLPSAKSIMWILSVNLIFAFLFRFNYCRKNLGLIVLHSGLLVLLISGFVTSFSQEYFLNIKEGEINNLLEDYYDWELVIADGKSPDNKTIISLDNLRDNTSLYQSASGLDIKLNKYFKNAQLFDTPFAGLILKEMPLEKDYEKNIPGLILSIKNKEIKLEGLSQKSATYQDQGFDLTLLLRRQSNRLPFSLELIDVSRELHPGTEIAKSYSSKVRLHDHLKRELEISMNKPLRSGLYTIYQASYGINEDGEEFSVFAVVRNLNYFLPYVGSLLAALGLWIHFILMYLSKIKKQILLALVLACCSHAAQAAKDFNTNAFKQIVVVDAGRTKPFETYANYYLLRLSGKSNYQGRSASAWLTKALFEPDTVLNDKIFLINNPETVEALGIKPDHKRRYSFKDLEQGASKLSEYAEIIVQKSENERTDFDKELLRVFVNFQSMTQILDSFSLFLPHPDFDIKTEETKKSLGTSQEKNSVFDMLQVSNKLHEAMVEIEKLPASYSFNTHQDEILRLSISLYRWIEGHGDFQKAFWQKEKLLMIPSLQQGQFSWISPWELFTSVEILDKQELFLLQKIYRAYQEHKQKDFAKAIKDYNVLVKSKLTKYKQKLPRTEIELLYNQFKPFGNAKILYGLSLLLCFLTMIKTIPGLQFANLALIIPAAALHCYGLISRMLILERAPVSNLYETFVFVGFICVILGLILHFQISALKSTNLGVLLASISGFLLLMISGKFAAEGDTMQVLIAVLNSNFWLSTHVICITIGYAGTFAAGIVGHVYLTKQLLNHKQADISVELKNLAAVIYGILGFGICFSFLGTMLGGIWADQSWGRFWGWDPKENGALLIVLWTAVLFHSRLCGIIKQDGLAIGSIIGSIVVMLSWFGVNLLGVGLHSYGFTSGIASYLLTYIICEIIFIITYAIIRRIRSV